MDVNRGDYDDMDRSVHERKKNRKRGVNFSKIELDKVKKLVLVKYPVVLKKQHDKLSESIKKETWKKIMDEYNAEFDYSKRSVNQLKGAWKRIKKDLRSEFKTESEQLSPLQRTNPRSSCSWISRVDSHEIAGSLNIESQPCSSKSNIQFVTSDLDYLHDMDFGTIEESGLGHFTSTPIREKTATIVGAASVQERVEKEMEAQTSVAETQKTLSGSVEEDDIVMICPIDNVQPSVSQSSMSKPPSTQAKSTKQQLEQKREGISEVDTEKMDINAKKLQSAIDKLENISNRLIAASLADKYDQFGKYISSILRGFPPAKVNALKKKLVSEVLEALHEEEQEPAKTMKSTGTQVAMDKSSDTAFKSYLKEKENVKSVPTSTVSLGTNIPVVQETLMTGIPAGAISIGGNIPYIGGNMPIIFPGASTSSSYQLLPVFPMSASPRANVATMVTTQSLVSPVVSVQPLMASESVTTVAKSATGTLLAVTIPKPQMTETAVPGSKEIRGQKRQKTAAYIIKKCKQTHTLSKNISPSDESSSDSQSTSNGTQTEIVSQPEESDTSIDSGGRDMSRSGDFISQTPENRNMQSEGDSKNTGGRTVCQSVKSELQIEHEFQMDVEEGKELTQMKKDQEMFETVLCEGTSSTDIYIKEEAPDPEEPSPMTPSSTSPFECHLCHKDCRDRQELTAHLATSHFEDSGKGNGSKIHMEHSTEGLVAVVCSEASKSESYTTAGKPLRCHSCNIDTVDDTCKCSSESLATDQCDSNTAPGSLSQSLGHSVPQELFVGCSNPGFELTNYDSTKDTSIIRYVKECLSKSQTLPPYELLPVSTVPVVNAAHDGPESIEAGKNCCGDEQYSVEGTRNDPQILISTYDNQSGDIDRCVESSLKNLNLIKDEPLEILDDCLVHRDETKKSGNLITSSGKIKRKKRKDYCLYCKEWVHCFSRHIQRKHENESYVKDVVSKDAGSQGRKELLMILRKKGNYLASINGVIKAVKSTPLSTKLKPCNYCLGFYARNRLWRHRLNCLLNPEKAVGRALPDPSADIPAELLSFAIKKPKKPKNLRKTTKDKNYVEKDLGNLNVEDKTVAVESCASLELSTNKLTKKETHSKPIIKISKKKRHFTKWTAEEKTTVAEYFKNHIEECRPPKRNECELLMRECNTLFLDKTWEKIKVFVQNIYTRKIKL